jgi:uncharacterized membrane protein
MMPGEKIFLVALVIYWLGVVVCFGPATVQSEDAQREHREQCARAYTVDRLSVNACAAAGPSHTDGLWKAMLWPLWVSYTIAKPK